MVGLITWIILIAGIWHFFKKQKENSLNENRNQTPPMNPSAPLIPDQVEPQPSRPKEQPANVKTYSTEQQTKIKTSPKEQQTKIETRRKEQQATADRSRIHQSLHEKEEEEARKKEAAQKAVAEEVQRFETDAKAEPIQQFEFEDSDLMAEVWDLIVCGYPSLLKNQRDFISEGTDFLNRLSSGEA